MPCYIFLRISYSTLSDLMQVKKYFPVLTWRFQSALRHGKFSLWPWYTVVCSCSVQPPVWIKQWVIKNNLHHSTDFFISSTGHNMGSHAVLGRICWHFVITATKMLNNFQLSQALLCSCSSSLICSYSITIVLQYSMISLPLCSVM